MPEAPFLIAVFALAYAGMALAALGLDRHWRDLVDPRRPASRRQVRCLRAGAIACGLAALAPALACDGMAIGLLLWISALTAGALAVGATLAIHTVMMAKPRA
ncbi:DUF3325 domain-containing protein [Azospirillum sp. B4]|uniref:DUF3325 domain-containing protein n=1 Tax=Azospirillum sp. B4 TaxID=95605 RepID=UPI00034C5832|nr:DUF3325 domain-containing protein [Azospirillum sp. B4]